MKKGLTWIIVIAVIAIVVLGGIKMYNNLVTLQENVETEWGNVESQYQRRADLIPNLVSTVKGFAQHETEVFEAVTNARAKATQITVDPTKLTPETLQQYQAAQGELSTALGRLLAVSERYPELKSDKNFLALQEQLEGTENRIQVARQKFNDSAKEYNTKVRKFPSSIIAGIFGFEKRAYFEADPQAKAAPQVEF